ncbi:hypothetical protein ACFSM5_09760 [Lacibacterium aquatile]|uniref:DUF2946 domain-containing protein n=1 Tax=Lacibacterium aquatile TaxID=1168082 RepID=A0ABW5DQ85_9PROT
MARWAKTLLVAIRMIVAVLALVLGGPAMHAAQAQPPSHEHHHGQDHSKVAPVVAACPMVCCPCLPNGPSVSTPALIPLERVDPATLVFTTRTLLPPTPPPRAV